MRQLPQHLALAAVLVLAACGDNETSSPPDPLAINSRSPAPGTHGAYNGVTVAVGFNQPIDPATLTPATLQVKQGGVALPVALNYDAATRMARVGAPFLPESTYEVDVTTGVHTPTGSGLGASDTWTFTTLPWHTPTVVDGAGQVGSYTSVATDASRRVHVSYFRGSSRDLKYATCSEACAEPPSWQTVSVDTLGFVGEYTAVAVDGSGRVHVTYEDLTNTSLKYATCATACTTAANWDTVTVDRPYVGSHTSIAVDGGGRVHVAYQGFVLASGLYELKYATCASACTTAANWETVTVDGPGDLFGLYTSVAVDGSGRVHVTSTDQPNATLRYVTCAGGCGTATNWVAVPLLEVGLSVYGSSLALDSRGGIHLAYYAFPDGALRYATCATACSITANWDTVTVAPGSVNGSVSVVVNEVGRVHVFYYDGGIGDFGYATCPGACTTAANWRTIPVLVGGSIQAYSSLAADVAGRLHVSYYDAANSDLKYME